MVLPFAVSTLDGTYIYDVHSRALTQATHVLEVEKTSNKYGPVPLDADVYWSQALFKFRLCIVCYQLCIYICVCVWRG